MHWPTTLFGLANAAVIVCYTLVDGAGVRLSGSPFGYVLWLFVLNAVPLVAAAVFMPPQSFCSVKPGRWHWAGLGGLCTVVSYGTALWAMVHAPIALVAALRETSVLFGTVFAALFLRERFGIERYVAAGLVTAGAMTMKFF